MSLYVFDGNSITYGVGATSGHTYPEVFAGLVAGSSVTNLGVSAQTTQDMLSDVVSQVDPLFTAGAWYLPWELINSTYFDVATATTLTDYATLCSGRRSAGFKVAAFTGTVRNDFPGISALPDPKLSTYNTRMATINASVRANWTTYADALVDVAAHPAFADYDDTTYFQSDKVHLTDAGYAIVAALAAAAVNPPSSLAWRSV